MTNDERVATLLAAIKVFGIESQVDMCLEEMSELAKALLKLRRSPLKDQNILTQGKLIVDIREEIADVQIMLDQMRLIYGHDDGIEEKKLKRLYDFMEVRKRGTDDI